MDTQICKKCLKEKPLSEFPKHPQCLSGHIGQCRECKRAYRKEYNRRESTYKYNAANSRRALEKLRSTEEGKQRLRKNSRKYKERNKQKIMAHNAARKAILSGSLIKKPCEKCGEVNVEAHHEDYTKPLDVIWLCRKHHQEHHRSAG